MEACPLCSPTGAETILHQEPRLRVLLAPEPDYPGFCRVVWNTHVREMTDLEPADRERFMAVVFAVEATLRATLAPMKVNLASLGNQVPHLHWHVVPRREGDPTFPDPFWLPRKREGAAPAVDPAGLARRLATELEKR